MRSLHLPRLLALADRGQSLRAQYAPPAKPRAHANRIRVSNAAESGRTVVRLYGIIGSSWWDDNSVGASDLAEILDQIGNGGIDLHINSPGGDVFDGIAMHAALVNHPSDVTSIVDGVAASAASFIAMSGDRVEVEKPAKFMIHDAAGYAYGPPVVQRKLADLLDEISDTIAEMYADRAGGTLSSWRALMTEETWFTGAQAVEKGLADAVRNDRSAKAEPEPEPDEDEDEAEPDETEDEAPAESKKGKAKAEPEDRETIAIRARHSVHVLQRKG